MQDKNFYGDTADGLKKIIEISQYLLSILLIKAGRDEYQESKNVVDIADKSEVSDVQEATVKSNIRNLYHRKDGRWEYKKRRNGEVIRFTVSTKSAAIKKLQEIKSIQTHERRVNEKETVIGWTKYWLQTYKSTKSQSTKNNYTSIINLHMPKFFKDMKLKQLTPAILQEFLNEFNPNSRVIDYAYLTLRQSLRQAYINNKIQRNLAETMIKPRKTKKRKKTALSMSQQEDFLKILKTYDEDVQYFMIFSLIAGTRRQETYSFNLEDINEQRERIYIHGTKTEKSERKIKVSKSFIEFLKLRKSKPYFTRQPHYYSDMAQEIYKKAKIEGKTLHDLRHTCSTNLHYLGWPDKERQDYLGHASIIMTNDIYTNLQDDITKAGLIKLYNNLYLQI